MRTHTFLLLSGLAVAQPTAAQYFDNQVLDKGFETTDFFFTPSYLNPYGLEGFGPVVGGLVIDPLLDLQFSPSLIAADSSGGTRVYLDFRSSRNSTPRYEQYPVYFEGDAGFRGEAANEIAGISRPFLGPSSPGRQAEPLVSAAVFVAPTKGLVLGGTYRVLANDQSFYDVPQDIYRSAPGADFAGEVASGSSFAVVDIYSGADQMHQFGHFPSLYASYQVSSRWRGGVRVAFAQFDRDGESGTSFTQPSSLSNDSFSNQLQIRSQSYRHLDLSIGLDGALAPSTQVGFSVGRLAGRADQRRESTNQYASNYGTQFGGGDWSDYRSGGFSSATWDRSGGTVYGTLFLRHRLDDARVLTVTYRGGFESVDLTSQSTVADSAFSDSFGSGSGYSYQNQHRSALVDDRTGTGERTGTSHRLTVGLDWVLSGKSRLTLGMVGTSRRQNTESSERVVSSRYRFYDNQWTDGQNSSERNLLEDKSLNWRFSTRKSAVLVPVMLWQRLSEHFEILIGISRKMAEWRISEETTALFDTRIEVVDGTRSERHGFGERYREPTEYRTDISTTGILGFIASPSPNFDIRLLVSPRWSNSFDTRRTQWWLGFQVRP